MQFNGKRMIPSHSPERIERDHFERYYFACKYTNNKRVLDIACGVGYGCNILIEHGAKYVYGVDLSSEAIEYAKSFYNDSKIKFICKDILLLDHLELNLSIDVIVCFETIEHIEQYESTLSTFYKLLPIGGMLILSTPNRIVVSPKSKSFFSKPLNKYHKHEFSVEEMKYALKKVGFREEIKIYGQRMYPFKMKVPKVILKVTNMLRNPKLYGSSRVVLLNNQTARYLIFQVTK